MFQGYARGSVGDVVFARVKGQQVAKARNRMPSNPRSDAQMSQRSAFLCSVLFFSRGNQAQFKFAYDDKRSTESDYNAFMRHNAKVGIMLTPEEKNTTWFPALGQYLMSKGPLSGFVGEFIAKGDNLVCAAPLNIEGTPSTIAELSAMLIASSSFINGDIITAYAVSAGKLMANNVIAQYDRNWLIKQIRLDVNDSTQLADLNITIEGGKIVFGDCVAYKSTCCGCGVIHSRVTANGTIVSDSLMTLSADTLQFYRYRQSKVVVDQVLLAWGAAGSSVLSGSMVANNGNAEPTEPMEVSTMTVDGTSKSIGATLTVEKNKTYNVVVNGTGLASATVAAAPFAVTSLVKTGERITFTLGYGSAANGSAYDVKVGNVVILKGTASEGLGEPDYS